MDTIFAQATAPGQAGVSVIRISGPDAIKTLKSFDIKSVPVGRPAVRILRSEGQILDKALILTFPERRSFTGEETVELHVHGSPAVTRAVLNHLAGCPGCRAAEAGEFTKRALLNDRMSLVEVEALGDLIAAETEAQRRLAIDGFDGGLSEVAEGIRSDLLTALALVEATIDFADEDVPVDVLPDVARHVESAQIATSAQLDGFQGAEIIRDGFEIAIVGPPNAGKSTLLNYLAGREVALTSVVAGTTRDVLEVRLDLDGFLVTVLDTAGIHASDDHVESLGIERGVQRARAADLRVFLGDVGSELLPRDGDVITRGKQDDSSDLSDGVSGLTGAGVPDLLRKISERLQSSVAKRSLISHGRQRDALQSVQRALDGLSLTQELLEERPELLAAQLRSALLGLDALVGRTDVEDVLGEIFGRFCIGK